MSSLAPMRILKKLKTFLLSSNGYCYKEKLNSEFTSILFRIISMLQVTYDSLKNL